MPLFLLLLLTGCAQTTAYYASTMSLRPGMTKKEVVSVMGPAPQRELYQKHNMVLVEYLIYPNFSRYEDVTPICFINNKVVGWGRTYYEDHVSDKDLRLK